MKGLFFTIILLLITTFAAQVFVTNHIAIQGTYLGELNHQLVTLKAQNQQLRRNLNEATSLSNVSFQAQKKGFQTTQQVVAVQAPKAPPALALQPNAATTAP